ncbi:hypothetical protein ACIBG5_17130 [Kribbella sp. NPDC050241]|uniref:hypothetical protein n=1 Tax=Kribbella sp. NPDC050241 TaxID=3364115 RepID=UPI0037B023AC
MSCSGIIQCVLLPAKIVDLDATALPQLSEEFQTVATSNKVEHHLIPGIEPYTPGDHLAVFNSWGLLICKDVDFPALSRSYGKEDVGLLLVSALDFENDGWLHSRMALLRGIENGIPMARDGWPGWCG